MTQVLTNTPLIATRRENDDKTKGKRLKKNILVEIYLKSLCRVMKVA